MSGAQPPEAQADAIAAMLDHSAIVRVINEWGLFRDAGRWDQLLALYAEGATMQTTWFGGSAREFVERSIEAKKRGGRGQHFVGAAVIDLRGDRAIAETRMILMIRTVMAGVPVDITSHSRFYDRMVREGGSWRFLSRVPIYARDRMDPIEPGRTVPVDAARLAGFPEAYRHLAYMHTLDGATLTPGLCTVVSAEEEAVCAGGAAWLNEGR